MKRLFRFVLGVGVAVVIILVALNVYLNTGLTRTVRRSVLPKGETMLGVDLDVGNARANLFRGTAAVSGLHAANPDGFLEPHILTARRLEVDAGIMGLLRGITDVQSATLREAHLAVVRDSRNEVNALIIRHNLARALGQGDEPVEEPGGEPQGEPAEWPELRIGALAADAVLEYVDHKVRGDEPEPYRLAMQLTIMARDIATIGNGDTDRGAFTIRGHLRDDPDAFITDLKGTLAPLTDPLAPTFDVEGTIAQIGMHHLEDAMDDVDVRADAIALTLDLQCRGGAFDADVSVISVALKNARLTGRLAQKAKGMQLPPDLSVDVPVGGTLDAPQFDFQSALLGVALKSLSTNVDALLEAATIDGKKLDEGITDSLKKLGKALGL